MTDRPITLSVPEYVYDRARQLAESTSEPIERVMVRQLEAALSEPLPTLPPNEQDELDALQHLSSEALWTIAREQMPADQQTRMQVLMDANTKGTIAESASQEFSRLVETGQRLMLRKAQAASLLTKRGFTVKPKDMAG
jgi:hypothetical protein